MVKKDKGVNKMVKKEEKAKVGRPKLADNETKKKAITYLALSFVLLMVFAIGATFSLFGAFSANNLKGAIKSSSSGCTIYASNINTKYADMYWSCTGSVHAKQFTTYYSNSKGTVGKKVGLQHNISTFPYGSGWKQDGLMADSYFIFSLKLSNGDVINKLFKTPAKGELPGDKKPTSYISVTNITQNSAKATYHLQGCGNLDNKVYLQAYKNSKWVLVKEYSRSGFNNDVSFSGLSAKTKYRVYIKTHNKANPNGSLYKEFTTSAIKTTTKKPQGNAQNTTKKTTTSNTFTIKFHGENNSGVKGTMLNQKIVYGTPTKISKNLYTRSGYVFKGWTATMGNKIVCKTNNDKTYKWCDRSKTASKYYYIFKNQEVVNKLVLKGQTVHMYAQWNKVQSNSCSSYKNQNSCSGAKAGEWKNTCVWKQNACYSGAATVFKVVYYKNNNNATGTMANQYITYGVKTKLQKNAFKRSGYSFKGWTATIGDKIACTTDNGKTYKWCDHSTTASKYYYIFKDQQEVNKVVAAGQTLHMYAQWKASTTQGNAESSSVFKIVVSKTKKNCFNVSAPSNAKYWRVHVYYKTAGASAYGTNKIFAKNHYNDNVKSQEVCFNKGNGDYRILVKKTTGANDKVSGNPSSWKPAGGSVNSSIGWAYKDYNGYKAK